MSRRSILNRFLTSINNTRNSSGKSLKEVILASLKEQKKQLDGALLEAIKCRCGLLVLAGQEKQGTPDEAATKALTEALAKKNAEVRELQAKIDKLESSVEQLEAENRDLEGYLSAWVPPIGPVEDTAVRKPKQQRSKL